MLHVPWTRAALLTFSYRHRHSKSLTLDRKHCTVVETMSYELEQFFDYATCAHTSDWKWSMTGRVE